MAIAPSNYKYEIQEYNINLGQSEEQLNQSSESKAIYYHSQGDFNKALEIIETINNPNYDLILIKADSYLKIGRHEKALELYQNLNHLHPSNPLLEKIASINYNLGENETALCNYNGLIENDPSNPYFYAMKASVCFNLINDSESIDAYITSIREFVNNKDLEAALDVYEHLLTINPDDAGALFSKSVIQYELNNNNESNYNMDIALELLIKYNPIENLYKLFDLTDELGYTNLNTWCSKSKKCFSVNKNKMGIVFLDRVLELLKQNGQMSSFFDIVNYEPEQNNPFYFYVEGKIMGTQSFNKPEDKIKKVRRAYKKAADFWEYEDKIELVQHVCNESLKLEIDGKTYPTPQLCTKNADLLLAMGHKRKAADAYMKAMQLYEQYRNWSEMEICCKKALKAEAKNPYIYEKQAKACKFAYNRNRHQNKKNQAIKLYEKAAQLYNKSGNHEDSNKCIDEVAKIQNEKVNKASIPYTGISCKKNIKTVSFEEAPTYDEFLKDLSSYSDARTLAISDDELLIYQMYKENQNIVPTLRHTGAGYYTEYRKLEHFFTNLFFQMFRERIISISEDEYVIDDKKLRDNFLQFRAAADNNLKYLFYKNSDYYMGTILSTPAILFFKKLLIKMGMCPGVVDKAKTVASPGSALFFLELYINLKDISKLQEFQQKISATNEDEIDNVLARPVLMLNPWEHQKEGLNSWLSNKGFGILEMATATGKTVVGLMAIQKLLEKYGRLHVRILTHSKAILNQWRREVIDKFGILSNPSLEHTTPVISGGLQIHFNTIQSVIRSPSSYRTDLLIVDEVHHGAGYEFRNALSLQSKWRMGLSATVEGQTKLSVLKRNLGPVVYNLDVKKAISKGILPKFRWEVHPTYLSIVEVNQFDKLSKKISSIFSEISNDRKLIKDLSKNKQSQMNDLRDFVKLCEFARYRKIKLPDNWNKLRGLLQERKWIVHKSKPKVDDAVKLASKYLQQKKKIVLFTMDIATCENIGNQLKPLFSNVFVIHSQARGNVYNLIDKFKRADSGILIGAKMLDEGIDIPDAEIGINVSSADTRLQLVQRIGRVLRRKEGKQPIFHHYVALPSPGAHINCEDNLRYMEEISSIQDTAMRIGSKASVETKDSHFINLKDDAESMVRQRFENHKNMPMFDYGTLQVENILEPFYRHGASTKIISELEKMSSKYKISDEEWASIVRRAFPKEESNTKEEEKALDIPGYWWLLVLGNRSPKGIISLFQKYMALNN